uniref:Alpha-ketoglutarate-dependent dioxygenase AlkB n=2 Tax=Pseudomonas peradeniyensis TaxID=2745488 RepID=A0A923GAX7_9PSED
MGFILQLILLRPRPEQFTTWRSTLPLLPPSVLWSGAILSGLLNGYRNLDIRFRNNSSSRKLIDIQTWTLATKKKIAWPSAPAQILALKTENNKALLLSDSHVWAEKKLGRRGRWYAADLDSPDIQNQAIEIAHSHCPEALFQAIKIKNGRNAIQGSGRIKLETGKPRTNRSLVVRGEFYLPFSDPTSIVKRLDKDIFKHWIATATVDNRLPGPLDKLDPLPTSTAPTSTQEPSDFPVAGLRSVPDFISEEQERHLVNTINNSPWSTELKRRVQHYGWKYDYRARGISPSAYLGPLPDWAQDLAHRLVIEGLMPELADQVIINEYILQQGISRHIDCIDCFKGPVITISLLESWQMIFRKGSQKADIMLKQRSATVLDGPARYEWTHEIPQRKYEKDFLRSRRISITFRKVKISNDK